MGPSSARRRFTTPSRGLGLLLLLTVAVVVVRWYIQRNPPSPAYESWTWQLPQQQQQKKRAQNVIRTTLSPADDVSQQPLEFPPCTPAQLAHANQSLSWLRWTVSPHLPWLHDWMASDFRDPFTAIFVGCHTGRDALDTHSLVSTGRGPSTNRTVAVGGDPPRSDARTFCVEPVGINVALLRRLPAEGLVIHQAALSNVSGHVRVPDYEDKPGGIAFKGLDDFAQACPDDDDSASRCPTRVPLYTLDQYVAERVAPVVGETPTTTTTIHRLSVTVQSYEVEILQGGQATLPRVYYLEFQYGKRGPWPTHSLQTVVTQLHHDHGFVCYLVGNQRAWRITGCWRPLYDRHTTATIGCVSNRHAEARLLLHKMEQVSKALLDW